MPRITILAPPNTASGGGGNTINAASASQADVQTAIDSASAGDTVQIPSGSATWTGQISTSKAIHIKGAGGGRVEGLSRTSLAIGTGSKTFTLDQDAKSRNSWINDFTTSETVRARCRYNAANWMEGTVTSWNSTTRELVLNISTTGGSGTIAYWVFEMPASTTITVSSGASPALNLTEPTSGTLQVSQIRFIGGTQSDGGAHISLNEATSGTPILIHDCRFTSGDNRVMFVRSNKGVIYRNYFDNRFDWDASGNNLTPGYGIAIKHSISSSWSTANSMGSDNDPDGLLNVYIEDCFFTGYTTESMDPDDNSRVVIQYCRFDNSGIASHGQDTSPDGLRHVQLVGNGCFFNDIGTATANMNYWFFQRGGSAIVYDNACPDITSSEWGAKAEHSMVLEMVQRVGGVNSCYTGAYPFPRGIGVGHNGSAYIIEGVYAWNNSAGLASSLGDYGTDDCGNGKTTADYVQLNRDYFTRAPTTGEPLDGWTAPVYPHPLRA